MNRIDSKSIGDAIKIIKSYLFDAYHYFYLSQDRPKEIFNEDELRCEYSIEKAFISTLVLLEVYELKESYTKIDALYTQAKTEGFCKCKMGIEDPYLIWGAYLEDYLDAIALTYDVDLKRGTISKDILSILKAVQYSITDTDLFKSPPSNESEVHLRIEGILRCLFTDLKHKPTLTKAIKNFEPDTGLPSIKTLIEYKFISNKSQSKKIVDELLADSRGYISRDWDRYVYVIYETTRIRSENEWKQLFSECGVQNTEIIVISGEPLTRKPKIKTISKKD